MFTSGSWTEWIKRRLWSFIVERRGNTACARTTGVGTRSHTPDEPCTGRHYAPDAAAASIQESCYGVVGIQARAIDLDISESMALEATPRARVVR
jgi:hypothetical protein